MLSLLWQMTRGNRLTPWRSPFLRWRIETYWGLHAYQIGAREFFAFLWQHRSEMFRFAGWADRQRNRFLHHD